MTDSTGARRVGAPLRIVSLAKQIPHPEAMQIEDGRLVRAGVELEMNAYCRRAVAEGVTLASDTRGTCTVVTLGPPSAEDVLREAIAWGADAGLHLCDPAFAGSDTLATARALAAAVEMSGPYDLVLLGLNSLDGETGQVGPEMAELLDLPFACGVRRLEDLGDRLRLELEHDDGMQEVEIALPALVSVAERLCDPCKVDPAGRAAVPAARITRVGAAELGPGPWGLEGSPTVVGAIHPMEHDRARLVLEGPVADQVEEAIAILEARGALDAGAAAAASRPAPDLSRADGRRTRRIAVLDEPGRAEVAIELVAAAARLGGEAGAVVELLRPTIGGTGADGARVAAPAGTEAVVELHGSSVPEDVADAVTAYVREQSPWALLAPSTAFGREVAARVAAATGSGLVGDAVSLEVRNDVLVAGKPAFAGALVADITCRTPTQMVTVRPGVLPASGEARPGAEPATQPLRRAVGTRGRLQILGERRNDDLEALARAQVVIGVGSGVAPEEYETLSPIAAVLGAEMAATRKVTDKGWAPRARQVGITGRSIAPRLYVGVALSGKFNHIVGVRAAGTILAVNDDRNAPVFEHCDIGIVGDWHEVVPLLQRALAGRQEPRRGAPVS
ncbi:MAG TPA: FAD-binding protein [Acidimicrobiales bacterium]|jgi:electron transfer flavoprotein alpha subunit|nr:FAD-binding protein [Acidimicrobiales bacterium]